jgi:hypothetical protein
MEERMNVICEFDNTKCSLGAKSIKMTLFQKIVLKDGRENTRILLRKISENEYANKYVRIE